MVFGEGLPTRFSLGGQNYNFLSGGFDVVAHELTHARHRVHLEPDLPERVGRAERVVLRHHGHQRRVLRPQHAAAAIAPADYLIGEDIVTPARAGAPDRPPLDVRSALVRRPRPLLDPLHRSGGQRRRAHQLGHPQPRLLPGHRGRHQPHLGPGRHRRRRRQPRADRAHLLSRLHQLPDAERHVRAGPPGDAARRVRAVRRRQRRRSAPCSRRGRPWGSTDAPASSSVRHWRPSCGSSAASPSRCSACAAESAAQAVIKPVGPNSPVVDPGAPADAGEGGADRARSSSASTRRISPRRGPSTTTAPSTSTPRRRASRATTRSSRASASMPGRFVRIWKGLAAGVAFTSYSDSRDIEIEASLPHPLKFNSPRTITGTAGRRPRGDRRRTSRSPTSCRSARSCRRWSSAARASSR